MARMHAKGAEGEYGGGGCESAVVGVPCHISLHTVLGPCIQAPC